MLIHVDGQALQLREGWNSLQQQLAEMCHTAIPCTVTGKQASKNEPTGCLSFQAFTPVLLERFLDVRSNETSPVGQAPDGKLLIRSPQVLQEVRQFFQCPTLQGALTEDGNVLAGYTQGTAGISHWEQSVFYVRLSSSW
jgi:hypothetical protein